MIYDIYVAVSYPPKFVAKQPVCHGKYPAVFFRVNGAPGHLQWFGDLHSCHGLGVFVGWSAV